VQPWQTSSNLRVEEVNQFMKGVVTSTSDSLGDKKAFENYLHRFE